MHCDYSVFNNATRLNGYDIKCVDQCYHVTLSDECVCVCVCVCAACLYLPEQNLRSDSGGSRPKRDLRQLPSRAAHHPHGLRGWYAACFKWDSLMRLKHTHTLTLTLTHIRTKPCSPKSVGTALWFILVSLLFPQAQFECGTPTPTD